MLELKKFIETAQENLNDSLRHFENAENKLEKEFVDLKLQACIFQYDVCTEMASILRNRPEGFAVCVALKGLVLRLFEYDQTLEKSLIPRLITLSNERNIPIDSKVIKKLRQPWVSDLKALKAWHDVRNFAASHYGQNFERQIALLKSLDFERTMQITGGFLSFNMELLVLLGNAGLEKR